MNHLESFILDPAHRFQARFGGVGLPDILCPLTHLVVQHGVHPGRTGRALGFGHHRLGGDAVLFHQADEHIPLAAVLDGALQQPSHRAVVHRPVRGLDDCFQHEVGAFHLVPEHQVVLAELELLDVHDVSSAGAEQVQAGEHPAAARSGLVGHSPVVQHGGKGVVRLGNYRPVKGDVVDIVLGHRVLHKSIRGVGIEALPELLQPFHRQRAVLGARL